MQGFFTWLFNIVNPAKRAQPGSHRTFNKFLFNEWVKEGRKEPSHWCLIIYPLDPNTTICLSRTHMKMFITSNWNKIKLNDKHPFYQLTNWETYIIANRLAKESETGLFILLETMLNGIFFRANWINIKTVLRWPKFSLNT